MFAQLAEIPGVTLFSLQKCDFVRSTVDMATPPSELGLIDFTEQLHDFADTAGLIANLDLVISIDTAVAHLAAAMGKPVWLLLPYSADWRWLLDREDSPWYPTIRLFRQSKAKDWETPIQRAIESLRCLVSERIHVQP